MKRQWITAFLIIEAALYVIFMSMDLFSVGGSSTGFKYASILLCLLFSTICAAEGGDRYVPFAQLFTVIADFFLLVINAHYLAGVVSFIIAQSIYLFRLYKKAGKLWLPGRITAAVLAVLLLGLTGMFSLLNLASVFYYSLLLGNMALSWSLKDKKWRIFALGLTLFALCDLCVGIFNLGGVMPAALYQFSTIGMWLFYLPSQVLISLSAIYK